MMEECCAYCYSVGTDSTSSIGGQPNKLLCCGKCKKRKYCSKECQRLDWKEGSHKHFCTVGVGEFNVDWQVKSSTYHSGGLGVFALRTIQKDEIIMVERPIIKYPTPILDDNVPATALPAVMKLYPSSETASVTLQDIYKYNAMAMTDDDDDHVTGLFIRMSRVNHHCLGNTIHRYLENRGAKILVASRAIQEGEEITFSYVSQSSFNVRRAKLSLTYRFICNCNACTNPDIESELEKLQSLDDAILQFGSMGRVDQALQKGKALLALYDRYQMSSWMYFRTYYDLYQVAITKRKTMKQGIRYIKLAYESAMTFTSDEENASVIMMKGYVDSPTSHRNYMVLD